MHARRQHSPMEPFQVRISCVSSENSTRERFLFTMLFPLYARCSLLCYSHMAYNGSLGAMTLTGCNARSKKRVNIRSRIEMGKTLGSVSSRNVKTRPFSSLLCDLLWLPSQSRHARQDASYEQHWFGLHCCYLLTMAPLTTSQYSLLPRLAL